jgi:hypothetical protein
MQTFLPYSDFTASARCLDTKRLGKQRVEAWQIYQIVCGNRTTGGWVNHPAVKMWRGYSDALAFYYNTICSEWKHRGFRHNMEVLPVQQPVVMPDFIGDMAFHNSHKSNLLRKAPEHYGQYNWGIESNLPYIWNELTAIK